MRHDSEIPRDQRLRVLKRDGYRCVLCWSRSNLHIHHHDIMDPPDFMEKVKGACVNDPYLRTEDWDLVTLCGSCHAKVQRADVDSPLYKLVSEYLIRKAAEVLRGGRSG